jgi:prepilin-type N-terminal cleavage/methylation domain-containing protein
MQTTTSSHHMWQHTSHDLEQPATRRDQGYTLIEMLLVVLIFGILTGGAFMAVSGMTAEAADTGCAADQHALFLAVESYFAQSGGSTVPATGIGADRYEQTLVDAGLLRGTSDYHHLDAHGIVTPEADSEC